MAIRKFVVMGHLGDDPGQPHELRRSGKDLKAEVIAEAGLEQFSPNARFGFVLLEEIQCELA